MAHDFEVTLSYEEDGDSSELSNAKDEARNSLGPQHCKPSQGGLNAASFQMDRPGATDKISPGPDPQLPVKVRNLTVYIG